MCVLCICFSDTLGTKQHYNDVTRKKTWKNITDRD